jgi:hypothetical protein
MVKIFVKAPPSYFLSLSQLREAEQFEQQLLHELSFRLRALYIMRATARISITATIAYCIISFNVIFR